MKPADSQDNSAREREELERKNQEQIESSLTCGDDDAGKPAPDDKAKRHWPGRPDVT